ncbi:hypothetical protein EZL74_11015 [Flavobacterium silvisoli]|uniref:SIR2-like domain-containing protein n=1 Tax=Flavobacterium silvisoli TaxID=2529433 RepID=A0A4Q9YTW7_9FLAO|nr:hypothetical protein [Flavobacterium silvisoli]TBX66111.1 hypothetical protein EZL74_11015 [Flavobacterium silvisoli]
MSADNNKIAILVGAGAVENAWEPILNCFRPINGHETDADSINILLAKSICALRLYSKSPKGIVQLKEELESINLLKEVICDALKLGEKTGILKPRKEFSTILDRFVLSNPSNLFGIVTTNWDTVIDKEVDRWVKDRYYDIQSIKVFHIHGSIKSHEHLYLPSETSMENYRSDEENDKIGYAHYTTYNFLKEANSLILYGISLDPLDAELTLLLNGVFSPETSIREIIIINPEYQKIRKRVNILLFRKNHITIRCFHPENLDIEL